MAKYVEINKGLIDKMIDIALSSPIKSKHSSTLFPKYKEAGSHTRIMHNTYSDGLFSHSCHAEVAAVYDLLSREKIWCIKKGLQEAT